MSDEIKTKSRNGGAIKGFGLILTLVGFAIFLLGTSPQLFGLDRSEIIGFVQITVFTFGLGLICLGGYIAFQSSWGRKQKSIAAEIGIRLVGTGYVIAVASGMADVFGLGTRPLPNLPFFGFWQARGVMLGEILILIGFAIMIPLRRNLAK